MVGSESGTAFPDGGEAGEELKGLNVAEWGHQGRVEDRAQF